MAIWETLKFPLWFLKRYLFINTFQGPKTTTQSMFQKIGDIKLQAVVPSSGSREIANEETITDEAGVSKNEENGSGFRVDP